MEINHILVPYNASPQATKALYAALDLAKCYKAYLRIIYVVPLDMVTLHPYQAVVGEGSLTAPAVPSPQTTADAISRGAEIINQAKEICKDQKVKASFEVRQGSRIDEFLKLARQETDLIVLGVRNKIKIRKLFFGNVATALLNEAPCSLYIVRGDKPRTVSGEVEEQP